MKEYKPTMLDFIKYIERNKLCSMRLLNVLKVYFSYDGSGDVDYLEDISDYDFMKMRNAGKTSLAEFKALKDNFLQYISTIEHDWKVDTADYSKTYTLYSREEATFYMRSDILRALDTVDVKKVHFLEIALLEKFKRDGIKY